MMMDLPILVLESAFHERQSPLSDLLNTPPSSPLLVPPIRLLFCLAVKFILQSSALAAASTGSFISSILPFAAADH